MIKLVWLFVVRVVWLLWGLERRPKPKPPKKVICECLRASERLLLVLGSPFGDSAGVRIDRR